MSLSNDLLAEKAGLHIFYQKISNKGNNIGELYKISSEIKSSYQDYRTIKDNIIRNKLGYYRNNYIASILRQTKQNNLDQYTGFDGLLNVTKGLPRHILSLLRHAYKFEVFKSGTPFVGSHEISIDAQKMALKESYDWFYNDCINEGELGRNVRVLLDRLGELLRIETYAQKPVECSASSFTLDWTSINCEAQETLDWANKIGVLIRSIRQEKNSQKIVSKFHLNSLLCPRWGISVSRRGSLSFNNKNFDIICDATNETEFRKLRKTFLNSRHAPFQLENKQTKMDV